MLDLLDSLVRKSLITVESQAGHARYGILETIRQFAEEQLAATGDARDTRDRHANLLRRAGHRPLEPVGWASTAGRSRLGRHRVREPPRRLYGSADHDLATAAADRCARHVHGVHLVVLRTCQLGRDSPRRTWSHRPHIPPAPLHRRHRMPVHRTSRRRTAVRRRRARTAGRPPLSPVEAAWTTIWQGNAHRLAGHHDEFFMAVVSELSDHTESEKVWALSMLLYTSPGRCHRPGSGGESQRRRRHSPPCETTATPTTSHSPPRQDGRAFSTSESQTSARGDRTKRSRLPRKAPPPRRSSRR